MEHDSNIRDIYFDEDLEKILMSSRDRYLAIFLEEEVLRKIQGKIINKILLNSIKITKERI